MAEQPIPKEEAEVKDTGPAPKPKPAAKVAGKSHVWKWFTSPTTATTGKNIGKSTVICVVPRDKGDGWCGHELVFNNSTSALSNHPSLVHSAFMVKLCHKGGIRRT